MLSSVQLLSYIGCLSSVSIATPIVGPVIEAREKELAARQGLFQTMVLDSPSSYGLEDYGVWQLIDGNNDKFPDLAYIKTHNTTVTGRVEVHIASRDSGFQTRIFEAGTTFGAETNGTWQLVPSSQSLLPDLAYIKTQNTPGGYVEVHIASGASEYWNRTVEKESAFTTFGDLGFWSLYDWDNDGVPDLVYIGTRSTGSGLVEVHIASGASGYQQLYHFKTVFPAVTTTPATTFQFWHLAPYSGPGAADLVGIQYGNTVSNRVEVRIASGASDYTRRIYEGSTSFTASQRRRGFWSLVDVNNDGALDLAYIQNRFTNTGTVKVSATSG